MEYPLKIVVVEDLEGCEAQAWSKGHHDPCRFLRQAVKALRVEADDDEALWALKRGHDAVKYEWWRLDLARSHSRYDHVFMAVDGPGRGVFPVTVVWLS